MISTLYHRLNDVPGEVDFAVIVIPPEHTAQAMRDCVTKKVKSALIITAVNDRRESKPIARLADLGIYTYRTPEVGARVLAYLAQYGRYLAHHN